jgi:AcrR family transcriptional regulator
MRERSQKRTQHERSEISRRRVLDAAVTVLSNEGYSATSTLRIQQEAGISRGRLLHQFPSRDALLVAAVQHLAASRVDDLRYRRDWSDDPLTRIDQAVNTMWSTYHQPYFWAATELWVAARSNDELRQALLPQERHLGRLVRDAADAFFGAELVAHPRYRQVREILTAAMRGIALTYAIEPRDPHCDPHLDEWRELAIVMLGPMNDDAVASETTPSPPRVRISPDPGRPHPPRSAGR